MRSLVLISLLILNIFIWPLALKAKEPVLKVAFLDVGQGDAIYIEAPNGNQVLIDGGRDRRVLRPLGEVMPWDDKTLDLIIATHPDADHIGGLPAVLTRYQVLGIMENGQGANTNVYKAWEEGGQLEVKEGAKQIKATRGERITLDHNIFLDILYPSGVPSGKDTNDGSVVARLTYGETSFLLTGDATLKVEQELLLANPELIDVEVLKAGHHGSKTSSSLDFVTAASPEYVVISAGKDNSYGHPHPSVLKTIEKVGGTILRTDELGTILCTSNGFVTSCRSQTL